MEEQKAITKNKGGRPPKAVKRNKIMAFKCTLFERKVIEAKAKNADLLVSEYIRETVVDRQVDRRKKKIPPEILILTATLRQVAAYFNQIAKRRNSGEDFDPLQRAELMQRSRELKQLADKIESYYQ
ncbi:MAG: mobilization protein [Taibaiella sp.]|nr:mobilization protein [Taibaiella sp.]